MIQQKHHQWWGAAAAAAAAAAAIVYISSKQARITGIVWCSAVQLPKFLNSRCSRHTTCRNRPQINMWLGLLKTTAAAGDGAAGKTLR
jgi:hypothetical protein